MGYQGHIENGVVVFDEPVPLPNGTTVRVEAVDFWESCSLDELARRQGVTAPASADEVLGGWPDDEIDDGFEDTVAAWRRPQPS